MKLLLLTQQSYFDYWNHVGWNSLGFKLGVSWWNFSGR